MARTQSIRTASAILIEAVVVDPLEVPTYRRIAARARQLRELGMSDRAIAGRVCRGEAAGAMR